MPLARELSRVVPAFWLGLVGGCVEAAILGWRRLAEGKLVFVVSHYWWLGPVITALLIALATLLILSGLPVRFPRLRRRAGYAIPVFLAVLGVLLLFPAIAGTATMVLAVGLSLQASGWLLQHAPSFDRLARRSLPMLALGPLTAALVLLVVPRARSWLRDAGSAGNLPNVLLLVLDTVRALELGLYGEGPSISPRLDGFAAGGVVFDQAFSPASWTAPAHASLFTGQPASRLSIDWERPLDRQHPTLAEVLRHAGYRTMGVAANRLYVSRETGLARGFDWYEDSHLTLERALLLPRLSRQVVQLWRRVTGAPDALDLSRVSAAEINRRVLSWIGRKSDRPFFAFVNYFDAHAPYRAPEPHWSRHLPDYEPGLIETRATPSPTEAGLQRRAYRAAIGALDEQVGELLHAMLVRGALDNTLVIITADHGEEFLEHGLMGHGASLYTQSVRVPLVVVGPGRVPAGVRVSEPVSLDRIPATVLDLVGRPHPFPGHPLAGLWRGESVPPVAIRSHLMLAWNAAKEPLVSGPLASVQVGPLRYIHRVRDSAGQLYDHRSDPLETRDLARDPGAVELIRALRDSLRRAP